MTAASGMDVSTRMGGWRTRGNLLASGTGGLKRAWGMMYSDQTLTFRHTKNATDYPYNLFGISGNGGFDAILLVTRITLTRG